MNVNVFIRPGILIRHAIAVPGLAMVMGASAQSIVVASTTSTEQSGLFAHILPEFKR